jgi:predicted O-methyltransferase YrrM
MRLFMLRLAVSIGKFQRVVKTSWNLYRLCRRGNRITCSIADGVRAALKRSLTIEETKWIDRIEQLRTEMNASTTQITRLDYGAGHPGSNRTKEEIQAGVEVADTLGHVSRVSSQPAFWCSLLFKLIRTVRPSSCIEMGTAVGISTAYQTAALKLNGHGALVTLEGAASLADIARNNFQQLGLDAAEVVVGKFRDTLPVVLTNRRPVDYVLIDGDHDGQTTLDYFEQILPFLAGTALLVFDDIAWSAGMKRAWTAIAGDKRVSVAVDLGNVGLCVIDNSIAGPRYFSVPLNWFEWAYNQRMQEPGRGCELHDAAN